MNTETEAAGDGGSQFRAQGDTQLGDRNSLNVVVLSGFRTFQPATQLELLDDLIEPALAKPDKMEKFSAANCTRFARERVDCDAVEDDDFLGETYISLGEAARRDITKKSAIQCGRRWGCEASWKKIALKKYPDRFT